jgi:hypothetical protein
VFPVVFPNVCRHVYSSCADAAGNAAASNVYGKTVTGFTADASIGGYQASYFAIGR